MDHSETSVATLASQLDAIEANLDRGGSAREYKACLENLRHAEALLPAANLDPGSSRALAERFDRTRRKARRKFDLACPWPFVVLTAGKLSPGEWVDLLNHPSYWVRCRAGQELGDALRKPGAEALPVGRLAEIADSDDADARRWLAFALAGLAAPLRAAIVAASSSPALRGMLADGAAPAGEPCRVCRRPVPASEAHRLSTYSVNGHEEYATFVGCTNPFISPEALPVPPRDPLNPAEWRTVYETTRAEMVQMSRTNVQKQGADWDPPCVTCATCAVALGLTPDELAQARAAAAAAARGEAAHGVVTAVGEALRAQVKSPCFVATAAFGDRPAPEVDTLRRFRDEWLRRRSWGHVVIALYERVGPRMAPVVVARPRLAAAVRAAVRALVRPSERPSPPSAPGARAS